VHNLTQERVAAAGPGRGRGWRGHGSEDRIQEIVAFVPDPESLVASLIIIQPWKRRSD
jgi:hypothetical protein